MKRVPGTTVARLALPLKVWLQRFAFLLLIVVALIMMMFSKADNALIERARTAVVDAVAPIMAVLSHPAQTVTDLLAEFEHLAVLRQENRRLREENARLLHWQDTAVRLQIENAALRGQLDYVPERLPRYVTARVVADTGGAFARSVLVNAGAESVGAGRAVRRGQAAISGEGLVGRVVEVGKHSARLLLLTDINSGVPVLVGAGGHRAVLGGNNDAQPRLQYLPGSAPIAVGDPIVTSGDGGVYPPGLAVGTVGQVSEQGVTIEPYVDFSRLRYVRIIDFGAEGILPPPETLLQATPRAVPSDLPVRSAPAPDAAAAAEPAAAAAADP